MLLLLLALGAPAPKPALDLGGRSFVPLRLAGLGQYGASPALFLEQERGGKVLPVPIPRQSVLACEQALSSRTPAMAEVLIHCRALASRDDGIVDQLPWAWNPSELAKRDGVARLSGRDYPQGGPRRPESPYHLLLDVIRSEARAELSRVLLVTEPSESDGVVVSSKLMLVRRLPGGKGGAAGLRASDARRFQRTADELDADDERGEVPCSCAVDEALGLAIALRCDVHVESGVWESAKRTPRYTLQRDRLRIYLPEQNEGDSDVRVQLDRQLSRDVASYRLPWEYESVEALLQSSIEERALSALAAGVELPPAADATDQTITSLIEPMLGEGVRRDLRVRRAFEENVIDETERFTIETVLKRREQLVTQLANLVDADSAAAYEEAALLQERLRAETSYLDELLDSLPRPAFNKATLVDERRLRGEEEAAADLECLCGKEDGYEQLRRRRQEQRAAREFSMRFISEFRGQLPPEQLLRRLDTERDANSAKEQALRAAREARTAREAKVASEATEALLGEATATSRAAAKDAEDLAYELEAARQQLASLEADAATALGDLRRELDARRAALRGAQALHREKEARRARLQVSVTSLQMEASVAAEGGWAGGWAGLRARLRLAGAEQELATATAVAAQTASGQAACMQAMQAEERAHAESSEPVRAAYARRQAPLRAELDAKLAAAAARAAAARAVARAREEIRLAREQASAASSGGNTPEGKELERNRAALGRALALRAAEAVGEAAWDDAVATRVARQLVFVLGDWSAQECIARLDELVDAAGRGEAEARRALRELAGLARQLEEVQRRSRGEVEDQSVLAEERRELSEQMRAWAGQPDTGPT